MNIAAITISFNDEYKLNEWYDYYKKYEKALYLHIIVDNGSENKYLSCVKELFSSSIIIERQDNGGCTCAYNDGIRYALNDPLVDAIMLIGNDMRISKESVETLFKFLYSDVKFGMVSPILLAKNSNIVEDFGCNISSRLAMKPFNCGDKFSFLSQKQRTVQAVTGGMNLSKREFYETVGFQDISLFMYSDEVDMGLRANKVGYKLAVTAEAIAWHQHINPKGEVRRLPYTSYLMGRNKVYLAGKHFSKIKKWRQFFYHIYLFVRGSICSLFSKSKQLHLLYFIWGSYNGLMNNMGLSKIIVNVKSK